MAFNNEMFICVSIIGASYPDSGVKSEGVVRKERKQR